MKNVKTIIVLLMIVVLISIAAGYVAGFYVYREYKEKTTYLEKQAQDKFGALEKDLRDLSVTLENTMEENKIGMEDVLSKAEVIKEEIEEWKKGYSTVISQLRAEIEDLKVGRLRRMVEKLQGEIDGFKVKIQDMELKDEMNAVDLGKISVEK